jgi:hypothetical protein
LDKYSFARKSIFNAAALVARDPSEERAFDLPEAGVEAGAASRSQIK